MLQSLHFRPPGAGIITDIDGSPEGRPGRMRSSNSGTLKRREEDRVAKFLAIESGASIYALGAFGFSVFSDHVRYTCIPYSEMSGERSTTRAVGPSAKPRSPQIPSPERRRVHEAVDLAAQMYIPSFVGGRCRLSTCIVFHGDGLTRM